MMFLRCLSERLGGIKMNRKAAILGECQEPFLV